MKVRILFIGIISLLFAFKLTAQTDQPFKDINKKVKVLTLTNGKYEEVFDNDSIQQIGTALVNVNTMEVVKLQLTKEEQRMLDNSVTSRFLSVDPLTRSYPMLSPYQYASNSPIANIDLDGLEGVIATPLGSQNVITLKMAEELNKAVTVKAFKATFSAELPKKFIEHYAYGNGTPYHLNPTEMVQTNTFYTGLAGIVPADNVKFQNLLTGSKQGDKISLPKGYAIQGAAGSGGTLGRFAIELKGDITIDKNDKTKWSFSGQMRYTDAWDFKTNPVTNDDLQRSDWGNIQNDFGGKYLPGQGFNITSDWINVKQTSNDSSFDWFKGKPSYEQGPQNTISNEIKNNPKTANETKKEASTDTH